MRRGSERALRFVVYGRVQGVGFRYFVQRAAARLGLRGRVRNREDGSVEAIAAGDPEKLLKLRGELWRGPSFSRVERVEESEAEPSGETGFRITY